MKSFKAPDVHAPRFRKKNLNLLNSSVIEDFKKEYPEYKELDVETFKTIVKTFNGKLWQTVIDERDGLALPENLGYLFIGTCEKTNQKNVNFGLSKQLEVIVSHTNLESDSKLAKIFYTNYANKYKFAHRELWGFTAVRQFKRTLAKRYPAEWEKYVAIHRFQKVSKIFTKDPSALVRYTREYPTVATEAYDEFNFD